VFIFRRKQTQIGENNAHSPAGRPEEIFFKTRSADASVASFNKTKTRVIRGPPAPFVGRKFSKIS